MELKVFDDVSAASEYAAGMIADIIKTKSDPILGLATGASPILTYKKLVDLYESGEISFNNVVTFNLDEYCGLAADDVNSYHYFMFDKLFDHVDIDINNVHIPDGDSDDPIAEAACYDALIDSFGGIDIQLLGIGVNGHIGFNEPSDSFIGATHIVELSQSTIDVNGKYFTDYVIPDRAITMGIDQIMKAKKIIMLAYGDSKADIIYKLFHADSVTPMIPATALIKHPDCTVICDKEAARKL